jgi:hypothetical protein
MGQEVDPHTMPFQDTVKHSIQDALAQEGLVHLIATVITRYQTRVSALPVPASLHAYTP